MRYVLAMGRMRLPSVGLGGIARCVPSPLSSHISSFWDDLRAAYSLWLYNRAVSGNLKPDFFHKFSDPNGR
ncbi:hypothetical protein KY285_019170 [Solanum tuberosum]|nr:hypothetical protein KY285_019170 [Solanum tuberosum]